MKVNSNYQKINVKAALADLDSVFYIYQKLIKFRHENPVVVDGGFELVENTGDSVLVSRCRLESEKWPIVVNLSDDRQRLNLDNNFEEVLVSNYEKQDSLKSIILKPYEAFAVKA